MTTTTDDEQGGTRSRSYSKLLAALQAATGQNRKLDGDIALVFDQVPAEATWRSVKGLAVFWEPDGGGHWEAPHYTASLDAVLTLVPEGANCHGYDFMPHVGVEAYWSRNNVSDQSHWVSVGTHPTSVSIAFVIAALKRAIVKAMTHD